MKTIKNYPRSGTVKRYEEFLNEELKILKGPSDDEMYDVLKDLNADQILLKCKKFDLGEEGFQIAVDKGLLKNHTSQERLYLAAEGKSLKYIKKAIEQGADINKGNPANWTVLMEASLNGKFEIVKYLVEHGANINIQTKNDFTALMEAVDEGHFEIVKYLVEHGADLFLKSINNKTAYHYAADYEIDNGDAEMMYYLEAEMMKQNEELARKLI
jgi:ankyrin repeat protein